MSCMAPPAHSSAFESLPSFPIAFRSVPTRFPEASWTNKTKC